jgi:ribosomal protein L37AE/L43A
VEDRMRGRAPPPREERKGWYESEGKGKEGKPRDRFACENCGNPSLQFFADGLGRCPGCGQRFRYSSRPTSLRSKQKHKQFICSQCDSKNLQFFLDGRGVCPHCRREFRWKK